MNRTDQKFCLHIAQLPAVLNAKQTDYYVLGMKQFSNTTTPILTLLTITCSFLFRMAKETSLKSGFVIMWNWTRTYKAKYQAFKKIWWFTKTCNLFFG